MSHSHIRICGTISSENVSKIISGRKLTPTSVSEKLIEFVSKLMSSFNFSAISNVL